MAFTFNTFGPFDLDQSSGLVDASAFWKLIGPLKDAYGIYIFATRAKDGSLYPCYVGQTVAKYKTRLASHFRTNKVLSKIAKTHSGEDVAILLIAVQSSKTNANAAKTASRLEAVDHLESVLIGASMVVNKQLVNENKKMFYGLSIPGFLNDEPSERSEAAKHLAKMLNPVQVGTSIKG